MAETEYLLHISKRLGYLNDESYNQVENIRKEAAKTLQGLINSVRKET
jgi:four helix bundle protein